MTATALAICLGDHGSMRENQRSNASTRDDTRGMSNMQHAEKRLAQTNKLDIVVLKGPLSRVCVKRKTSGRIAID